MSNRAQFRDVIGKRGETKLSLCLTNYEFFQAALFETVFLGDKWPTLDHYVELRGSGRGCYFLAQAKSTSAPIRKKDRHLKISSKKKDVKALVKIPGPTYIFGVHEPSGRVFVQCIHGHTPIKAISKIPIANELTPTKLKLLHEEVRLFWRSNMGKLEKSAFL